MIKRCLTCDTITVLDSVIIRRIRRRVGWTERLDSAGLAADRKRSTPRAARPRGVVHLGLHGEHSSSYLSPLPIKSKVLAEVKDDDPFVENEV